MQDRSYPVRINRIYVPETSPAASQMVGCHASVELLPGHPFGYLCPIRLTASQPVLANEMPLTRCTDKLERFGIQPDDLPRLNVATIHSIVTAALTFLLCGRVTPTILPDAEFAQIFDPGKR